MSDKKLESMAKGRVWTGKDAVKLGLADEFGGINEAIDYIREKTGIAQGVPVNLVEFPKAQTLVEMFLGSGEESAAVFTPFSATLVSPQFRPLLSALFPTIFHTNQQGIQSSTDITIR